MREARGGRANDDVQGRGRFEPRADGRGGQRTGAPAGARWSNAEPWTGTQPAVLVTHLKTDPQGDVATVAWFRSADTQLALYPGTATQVRRPPAAVRRRPVAARRDLVATFNSGFYEKDAAAGFYVHNTLYHPMLDGLATVVAYSDGRVDIVRWTGGRRPDPGIVIARQNLALLVDGGHISPTAGILSDWGITWHGWPAVWRSAIGVDRNGNLIYAAGPADGDQHGQGHGAGRRGPGHATRYQSRVADPGDLRLPGAHRPTLATPNPNQIPSRFLYTSLRTSSRSICARRPQCNPSPGSGAGGGAPSDRLSRGTLPAHACVVPAPGETRKGALGGPLSGTGSAAPAGTGDARAGLGIVDRADVRRPGVGSEVDDVPDTSP